MHDDRSGKGIGLLLLRARLEPGGGLLIRHPGTRSSPHGRCACRPSRSGGGPRSRLWYVSGSTRGRRGGDGGGGGGGRRRTHASGFSWDRAPAKKQIRSPTHDLDCSPGAWFKHPEMIAGGDQGPVSSLAGLLVPLGLRYWRRSLCWLATRCNLNLQMS